MDVLNVTSTEAQTPPRGDRDVPCDGGDDASLLPVAKAQCRVTPSSSEPMVRPRADTNLISLVQGTTTLHPAAEAPLSSQAPTRGGHSVMTHGSQSSPSGVEHMPSQAVVPSGNGPRGRGGPTPKPVQPSLAAAAAFARSSATRQAHPESYTVILPQYLHLRPDQLRRRWSAQPSGDQKVVLFFTLISRP